MIIIHTDNPRLKEESLCGTYVPKKATLTRSVKEWLVEEYPYYSLNLRSRYIPKRRNKFVDTGLVGKRLEIAESTYTSSYNEYTGETRVKKVVDRFDSGLMFNK